MKKEVIISLHEQDAVEQFAQEVDQVIGALGIGAALVTDGSQVMDFLRPMVKGMDENETRSAQEYEQEKLMALSELTGKQVRSNDYIWELARDIHLRKTAARVEAEQRARPH